MLYNVGSYNWEEMIIKRYSIYDIFSYYVGGNFKIGQPINSPLREDNNPSFGIFPALNGDLMFKDFATGSVGGWVKFIQLKFNLPYRWAIIRVFIDLMMSNLPITNSTVHPNIQYHKKKSSIGLKLSTLRKNDIDYWKQYNISVDLLSNYNVIPVSDVWVNNNLILNRNEKNLIFAYLINGKIKVYSPLADRGNKWVGNTDSSCVFGIDQLPLQDNILIITKALKDVMTLKSLGYNAVSGNSETTLLKESTINNLKQRFKQIYVFLDNDEAGIIAAEKYKDKYELDYIIIPLEYKCKDISDLVKEHGIRLAKRWLKESIEPNG
jgi:5S rRNA maturation endonuclease (ribonuclease M5)